jgi:hypothetical protein
MHKLDMIHKTQMSKMKGNWGAHRWVFVAEANIATTSVAGRWSHTVAGAEEVVKVMVQLSLPTRMRSRQATACRFSWYRYALDLEIYR